MKTSAVLYKSYSTADQYTVHKSIQISSATYTALLANVSNYCLVYLPSGRGTGAVQWIPFSYSLYSKDISLKELCSEKVQQLHARLCLLMLTMNHL